MEEEILDNEVVETEQIFGEDYGLPEEQPIEPITEPETPIEPPKPEISPEMLKKIIKAKVDGEEFEAEVDLTNEEELRKMVQLSKMSNKRAQEAAELRKVMSQREESVKQLLTGLQSNPLEILKRIPNLDLKEIAAHILNEQLEEESLTPEQKRIRELEAEIKKAKEIEKTEKERLEKEKQDLLRAKYREEFDRDLKEAIQEQNLKYNPTVVSKMVQYMDEVHKLGLKATFKEIAPIVKEDLMKDVTDIFGDMPSEMLEKIIKADRINELVSKKAPVQTKKVVPPTANDVKPTTQQAKTKKVVRNIPAREFFKSI